MNLNNVFGIYANAMNLRTHRAEVLATNIANAETPNYLARDFDFGSALEGAMEDRSGMITTQANHIQGGDEGLMGQDLMYRLPEQPSIDGNTVDLQTERAEFTKNAMQYQASVRFLNGKVSGLLSAIRGE